jgi:hypothetical protein
MTIVPVLCLRLALKRKIFCIAFLAKFGCEILEKYTNFSKNLGEHFLEN